VQFSVAKAVSQKGCCPTFPFVAVTRQQRQCTQAPRRFLPPEMSSHYLETGGEGTGLLEGQSCLHCSRGELKPGSVTAEPCSQLPRWGRSTAQAWRVPKLPECTPGTEEGLGLGKKRVGGSKVTVATPACPLPGRPGDFAEECGQVTRNPLARQI
jgi:hypothetical protein